jgi:hypothetical protein
MPTSQRATSETPIRVIIGNTVLTGRLWDNAAARDLIAQLPLSLTFRDFNGVEKIARLPDPTIREGLLLLARAPARRPRPGAPLPARAH